MKNEVKIAVIDNGVNEALLSKKLEHRMVVDDNGICQRDWMDMDKQEFCHGTDCALIIEKYCAGCTLSSIRILDGDRKGVITKLEPALEWCLQNGIYIVNLSLGSTHYGDKGFVRSVVNHYANKKMILIAAAANNGYITYPASLTNVIGVMAGTALELDAGEKQMKGIDVLAPSEHKLKAAAVSFETGKGNSYAAPYITALVGNMWTLEEQQWVSQMKKKIYRYGKVQDVCRDAAYVPDWMESAWFPEKDGKSKAFYYFSYSTQLWDAKEQDTVIVKNLENITKWKDTIRNMVYLGDKTIKEELRGELYWDRHIRMEQIGKSPKRKEDLSIPIIVCRFQRNQDYFLWLTKGKEYFGKEGYHIFTVSLDVESVLYDLEYIPEEMCTGEYIEIIQDFLYWQTYFQQSDAIFIGIVEEFESHLKYLVQHPDLTVLFKNTEGFYHAELHYDGNKENIGIAGEDPDSIHAVFKSILNLLTEEAHE